MFSSDNVAHHTILFGPRYKGLLDDIFKGSELPEDFSLYLHVPTVTDPSLAPEGCSAAYVLAPVPHLGRADVDWDDIAEAYGDRIIEALEVEMPDLHNHIATLRHITPKTFERELAAFKGSAFSVAPKLTQSAYFRPSNKDPDIPGLYLVGAGTHPGGGRTRIRTRVFGLEGQSDIQLHYTSLVQARGSHLMKVNHQNHAQSGLAHL